MLTWDKTLDYIKKNYIYKDEIDWLLLTRLLAFVESGKKIKFMISFLNNTHSRVFLPERRQLSTVKHSPTFPSISGTRASTTIKFYSFMGSNIKEYVESVQLSGHYSKITIDLRENGGGNGHPMILSLASLWPLETPIGYFAIGGKFTPIVIQTRGDKSHPPTVKLFALSAPQPPRATADDVIVQLGPKTASSGEWMAVCLRCLPNVKFVGNTTGEFNSVNNVINTQEGFCAVTVGYYADWQKKIWKGPLLAAELNKPAGSSPTV